MGEFNDGDEAQKESGVKAAPSLSDLTAELLHAEKQLTVANARHKSAMEAWQEAEIRVRDTKEEAEKALCHFDNCAGAVAEKAKTR